MLQLKRFGLYFKGIMNRKWLLSYRNKDISYRDARGFGSMLPEKFLKWLTQSGAFLVVFFSKKLPIVVVRDVCPSVRLSSVEIFSFRGNSLSSKPIDLKIGLNVREGVVHVRKAWFFEILIAKLQIASICNFFANKFVCTVLTDLLTRFCWKLICKYVIR